MLLTVKISHSYSLVSSLYWPCFRQKYQQMTYKTTKFSVLILKKKTLWSLFIYGFNCLKARATSRRKFNFFPQSSQKSQVPILLTLEEWMAESTLEPPSGFLSMGPLDWESSTLTNRPLLLLMQKNLLAIHFLPIMKIGSSAKFCNHSKGYQNWRTLKFKRTLNLIATVKLVEFSGNKN